jgi:hypothetical protein
MSETPEYPEATEADMTGPADLADLLDGPPLDLSDDPDETPEDDDVVEDEL